MKRFLIIISTLFIVISPAFSVEWGGVFNNDSQGMLFAVHGQMAVSISPFRCFQGSNLLLATSNSPSLAYSSQ